MAKHPALSMINAAKEGSSASSANSNEVVRPNETQNHERRVTVTSPIAVKLDTHRTRAAPTSMFKNPVTDSALFSSIHANGVAKISKSARGKFAVTYAS